MRIDMAEGAHVDHIDDTMNYGCVFCITGREDDVASYIRQKYPQIMALPAAQMKHKSVNGKRTHERHIMLPGYVFLRTEAAVLPITLNWIPDVIRVLYEQEREWQLQNENKRFAKWVFQCGGLVDVSKVCMEGQIVRAIEGPLKEMQGAIIKIDKRNRNCLVAFTFNNNTFKSWLAFDYIEPTK